MDRTIDLLVENCNLPLSIIIVGVGNADFTNMNRLDGDNGLRTDYYNINGSSVGINTNYFEFNRFGFTSKNTDYLVSLNQDGLKFPNGTIQSSAFVYSGITNTIFNSGLTQSGSMQRTDYPKEIHIKINGQNFTGSIFTFNTPVASFVLSGTYSDKAFNQSLKYFYNPSQITVKKSNVNSFLKTDTCFVSLPQSIDFIYSFSPPSSSSSTYSYILTTGTGTSMSTQTAYQSLSYSIDIAVQKLLNLL